MIAVLLLLCVALADPGIVPVPAGRTVTAAVPSYLLPEVPYYNECLAQAKALPEVRQLLDDCVGRSEVALEVAQRDLDSCDRNFTELSQDFQIETERSGKLELRLEKTRRQRNTAIFTAAGLGTALVGLLVVNVAL